MIYTALDNFYLTEEQLENSPSRKDGIDRDTEATLRVYGTELIQEAGILLKYAQAVMATGQVLFHRFYCKRSMKEFNVRKLAATALWLAAKLEEAPGVSHDAPQDVLKRILVVVDRVCARRETTKVTLLDVHSSEYHSFMEACIKYEREMLKVFGFVTHVEHPHKMMLNYCQILGLDSATEFPGLLQEAWSLLNDSLRTTLCVRFKSTVVACGIIFMAARRKQVALPEDPPWWELFNVQPSLMFEVCREMHQLYARPQAQYIPVYRSMLASKPPTPASPSGHQRLPEGSTGERLGAGGAHNTAGTPAFTPQAAADLERPSSQVDLLLAADAGANTEQQPQHTHPANGTQQAAQPPSPAPANTRPGSARKRSRSPEQQQQQQQGASRRPRWDADGASDKGPARAEGQQGPSKGRHGSEADKGRGQQRSRSRDRREGERKRSRSRSRSRSRDRSRRHRSRSRDRDRERHRDRDRERDRDTDRERRERDRERRDRRRSRSRSRSRGRQVGHRSSRDAKDSARTAPAPAPEQQPHKQSQASTAVPSGSRQEKPAGSANGTASAGGAVLPPPPAASDPKAGAALKLPPPPRDPAASPTKPVAGAGAPAGSNAGTGQPPAAGAEVEQEQGKQEGASAAPRKHVPILPPSGPPPGKGPPRGA